MEITLNAGDLANTIALVKGIVPSRTTIPILNNVLLDTHDGRLSITATNLDVEATVTEPAEIIQHGRVTIPGHVLHSLAKSLPKTKLATLKIEGDRAILTCGKSRYDLGTLPAEDFPTIEGAIGTGAFVLTMPAAELKSALSATRHAHSTEETRFYLCGTHIARENDRLAFVATDGHKLVHILTDVPLSGPLPHVIVPSDSVQNILAVIDKIDGDVTLAMDSSKIELTAGSVRLVSKLIAGQYPDYQRVLPGYNSGPNFTASAAELGEAVARLSTIASDMNPGALVETNGTAIDIMLRGKSQGVENVDAVIGEKAEFGANIRYLADMIGLWPTGADLKFTHGGGRSPILITSDAEPKQQQVIMPMRV